MTKSETGGTYQQRVDVWLLACFGETISRDREERNHRFIEEALELVQANGCTKNEAHQLVDYVYSRPEGDLFQEVGGVMNTLAALCLASGVDLDNAAEAELARVWTKVDAIRAKQAAKPKHSPLPIPEPPADVSSGDGESDADFVGRIDREYGGMESDPTPHEMRRLIAIARRAVFPPDASTLEIVCRAICKFEGRDPDLTGDSADAGAPKDQPRWRLEEGLAGAILTALHSGSPGSYAEPLWRGQARAQVHYPSLEQMAEAINEARYKIPNAQRYKTLAESCETDREYCYRLAKAVRVIIPAQPDDTLEPVLYKPLAFTYRNYRGEVAERLARPISVRWGSTEWHPEPQWLLLAFDVEKGAEREFAMRDMGAPAQPDAYRAGLMRGAEIVQEERNTAYRTREIIPQTDSRWQFWSGASTQLTTCLEAIRTEAEAAAPQPDLTTLYTPRIVDLPDGTSELVLADTLVVWEAPIAACIEIGWSADRSERVGVRWPTRELPGKQSPKSSVGGDVGGAWRDCDCPGCVAKRQRAAAPPAPVPAREVTEAMVELGAAAIFGLERSAIQRDPAWESLPSELQDDYREQSRAALTAAQPRANAGEVTEGGHHEVLLLAVERAAKKRPWEHCPSTHCERCGECASPNDCMVKSALQSKLDALRVALAAREAKP